jgi:hypothetical protein
VKVVHLCATLRIEVAVTEVAVIGGGSALLRPPDSRTLRGLGERWFPAIMQGARKADRMTPADPDKG